MGHTVFTKDRIAYVKPLQSKLEAIQKLNLQQQLMVVEVLQEM